MLHHDCVFAMSSGRSGVTIARDDDPAFLDALRGVAGHLAREIVRGGEGATKLITVHVIGASTHADAWLAARTIANSPLVKTAVHGGDPNWGRLVAAAGRSGAAFDLARTSVSIGDVPLSFAARRITPARRRPPPCERRSHDGDDRPASAAARNATMWTCDFSATTKIKRSIEHERTERGVEGRGRPGRRE